MIHYICHNGSLYHLCAPVENLIKTMLDIIRRNILFQEKFSYNWNLPLPRFGFMRC